MKHLKTFENSNQVIWVFKGENMFESDGSFTSYTKTFDSKQSCINHLINFCNDLQIDMMKSDQYTEDIQEKYSEFSLHDEENCLDFLHALCEEYSNDEFEFYVDIAKDYVEHEEIKKEYKLKIDAKKYNL